MTTEHKNIYEAIQAVKVAMPEIAKDGSMPMGGSKVQFQRIVDMEQALFPLLLEHEIIVIPTFMDERSTIQEAEPPLTMAQSYPQGHELAGTLMPTSRPVGDGKIPTTRVRALVIYAHTFHHVPSETNFNVQTVGEAMDTNGDKATNKATTAAWKKAVQRVFGITDPTEQEADETDQDEKNRAATTDRRMPQGQGRGGQARGRAAAGGGQRQPSQRSASTSSGSALQRAAQEANADASTGEVAETPAPAEAPAQDRMGAAKLRMRTVVGQLGINSAEVDQTARDLGFGERGGTDGWLTKVTHVEKIATELESRVKE